MRDDLNFLKYVYVDICVSSFLFTIQKFFESFYFVISAELISL